jgi:hypothetical protein
MLLILYGTFNYSSFGCVGAWTEYQALYITVFAVRCYQKEDSESRDRYDM